MRSERTTKLASWMGISANLFDVPIAGDVWFENPVSIRPLVAKLEFVHNKEVWGTALQSGVTKISGEDFQRIVSVTPARSVQYG